MLRALNIQSWVRTEHGINRDPSLRIRFSIVTSAVLSIMLASAGSARAQTVHLVDYPLYEPKLTVERRSTSTSDGGDGFRTASVLSMPGATSTPADPDIRLITDWHNGLGSPLPEFDPGDVHGGPFFVPPNFYSPGLPGSSVPEPSTLLLGLGGMVGALAIRRRHRI